MANRQTKIQIQIVTWNSKKFLPDCLASIFNQTYKDFSVLIIDNASNDGTIEFIKDNYPQVKIFRNNKNLGFSAAHNQGIKIALLNQKNLISRYILIVNPDIILTPNFLEKILPVMEKDKTIAATSGKSLKVYTSDPEIGEKVKTDIIDSAGLKIYKSGQVIDRGEDEIDRGQYDKKEEVFGLSASCVLYRLSVLEDIKINGEYLDEDFFAYKEDADLSYRLRWRGWKIIYFPEAIVYHHRRVFGGKPKIGEIIKRRQERSPLVKYLSYRNHFFLLIKNESFVNFLKCLPWILFYELKKFLYILFFERKTLEAIPELFGKLPKILKKRRWIMKNKKINSIDLLKWFE